MEKGRALRAHARGIVGAGAVGTELAGEIAHATPAKEITLIPDMDRLFPTLPGKSATRRPAIRKTRA